MRLPKELIEDFKKNVMIKDLSKKFGLSYFIINRELVRLGLKTVVRGGYRKGCGRKKIKRGRPIRKDHRSEELKAKMKKNTEINDKYLEKQVKSKGRIKPKFKIYRANVYYEGG